jgi:hypothetical protein
MVAAAATIASIALPPSRSTASALWLARWWGATAIPWADTLLCMGCPHDPNVMPALQKLFHFERKVSFVRGWPFLNWHAL